MDNENDGELLDLELDAEIHDLVDRCVRADAQRVPSDEEEDEEHDREWRLEQTVTNYQDEPETEVVRDVPGPSYVELSDEEDDLTDVPEKSTRKRKLSEDEDYEPEHEEGGTLLKTPSTSKKPSPIETKEIKEIKKIKDDGDPNNYYKRLKLINREVLINGTTEEFKEVDDHFRVPRKIWDRLFGYQKHCVNWLWELHQAGVGGIIGDEMGLGKTIQIIAFLSGLKSSLVKNVRETYENLGPVVIICPATVMHQWVQEFRNWYPSFRVAILHSSGSYSKKNKKPLVSLINSSNGVLITTYQGVTDYQDLLYMFEWHYVILDEGHKIRNPNAQQTLACKRFKTPHRIILSGSPIQNNLKELWSLFDFVYPGLLGTLPVFTEQFAVPITQGGYANATQVQVQVAFKCATVMRDTIKPYFLRRLKDDVKNKLNLPDKNEQILFCRLTDEQRDVYQQYLNTDAIKDIVKGGTDLFVGLTNLRKICNHPDLFLGEQKALAGGDTNEKDEFGYYKKSGKMQVVDALLKVWTKQGHKMMSIFKKYLVKKEYSFLSMDGSTPIGSRQQLITRFNTDKNIFVFLLTTRVGGLGVNLTGASRVLIFDPDWNPSTDLQARERAWRIGQSQKVTIYRLLMSGTIEEKIYHRQVFKQYLSNRVLKNPKQRRFFKTNDLYELFSLGNDDKSTETSAIFAGTGSDVKVKKNAKNPKLLQSMSVQKEESNKAKDNEEVVLPPEKLLEIRERAKRISQMLTGFGASTSSTALSEIGCSSSSNSSKRDTALSEPDASKVNQSVEKKKKKKHKKGIKFEGERIKYLVKKDRKKPDEDSEISNKQDDYVLKKLFKGNSVHSALQHDVIEGASNPDYMIVESEAEKVALTAIQALKRSKAQCFRASSGIPTWTGLNGHKRTNQQAAKKPAAVNSKLDEQSSIALLEAIKSRHRFDEIDEDSELNVAPEHGKLLENMKTFIESQPFKQAETRAVLARFQKNLPTSQTPVFKALLHKLCSFARKSDGAGVWTLKEEYL